MKLAGGIITGAPECGCHCFAIAEYGLSLCGSPSSRARLLNQSCLSSTEISSIQSGN